MNKKTIIAAALASFMSFAAHAQVANNPQWLDNAIFYQIYPSSYMDSDGNGIGDLPGIVSKLDYIKSLGITAIWLNPVFESGWFDGGYDVIDFYKIDPRFGTNTDMVKLIDEAHRRGIKVCLDLVAGHTSDKSPWFKDCSTGDRNSRYADYYIWTDSISPKEQQKIVVRHQAANPASSTYGRYVEANVPRGKYYEKNFFECQPALNYGFANPNPAHPWEQPVDAPGPQAVRRELKNIIAFWFDKGIDGFRVDMASSLIKNDKGKKAVSKLWNEMRAWKDKHYPHCVFISEWSNPEQAIPAGFNVDFMLQFGLKGYGSLFFSRDTPWGKRGYKPENEKEYRFCYFDRDGKGSPKEFAENYGRAYNATKSLGYIALPTANHDFQRPNIGTRNTPEQLKVAMTFFLTMPGVPFIYYGDEIGMKYQMDLPNKEGSNNRAGTRTPMQWTKGETAGFSSCTPVQLYLPVDTENGRITVEAQLKDPASLLHYTRRLTALRHQQAALRGNGEWTLLNKDGQNYPLVYQRSNQGETIVVAINPARFKTKAVIPHTGTLHKLLETGKTAVKQANTGDELRLDGFSAVVYKVE